MITPAYTDNSGAIYQGDSLEVLKRLPDESVQCIITSPPYFGLRDYETGTWVGGDESCSHKRDSKQSDKTITGHVNLEGAVGDGIYKNICKRCGAKREDRQMGLEETPEEYIANMVILFREAKRVLRDDGTLWLNLGDSYSGSGKGPDGKRGAITNRAAGVAPPYKGLPPKNLIGIPWRVALALQSDGWILRQDIIWYKRNPMPESVTDRCTKAHEYIFLFAKNRDYYFDGDAIKEPVSDSTVKRLEQDVDGQPGSSRVPYKTNGTMKAVGNTKYRNKRSVWDVTTKPFNLAHFATFPTDLIEPMVMAGCPPDGTVLDVFMGSGTTGLVAKKLGRKYIGIELNPAYIDIARIRLAQESLL